MDIKCDQKNATENQIVCNKIYLTISKKIIDPCERSPYQLIVQYSATDKGSPRTYKATKKEHVILFAKKINRMYLERLSFAIK